MDEIYSSLISILKIQYSDLSTSGEMIGFPPEPKGGIFQIWAASFNVIFEMRHEQLE